MCQYDHIDNIHIELAPKHRHMHNFNVNAFIALKF